jgi:uncharacterized protein (DUF1778 family)
MDAADSHADSHRANLTIRAPAELHSRLVEAAAWRGLSLNSFILQAAAKEADAILEQERVLRITADDAAMLLGLLDDPPKPNAALARAFSRRKEKLGAGH